MTIAAVVISILLGVTAAIHFFVAFYFRTMVMLSPNETNPDDSFDLASVVLAVRGCDPGLETTLIRLLEQDYENYRIHIVVDHCQDSAWSVAQRVKAEFDIENRLTIHVMQNPHETCGLKCSAIIQAVESIGDESKYLVLVDSDVTPHRTWLSQLVAPLKDMRIGVVTGNQWFEPGDSNVGSLVRSLWHAGSIVPTAIYANPWAGSFAMRMEDVERAQLVKIWKKSIVDDGPIRQAMKPLGLKIHFCPNLVMINREKCTLGFVFRYVARTLTWSKMYEPTFLNTIIHCIFTVGLLLLAMGLLAVTIIAGNWNAMTALLLGLIGANFVYLFSFLIVRNAISLSSNLNGQQLEAMGWGKIFRLFALTPFAFLIYGVSCVQAAIRQKIQWRQITYELRGKSDVKMLSYQRWLPEDERSSEASEVSI